MTVKELSDLYLHQHLASRTSFETTKRLLRNTFQRLNDIPVRQLTPFEVLNWCQSLARTPYQGNRALGVLRAMIRWGIPLALCSHDPTTGVKRFPVQSRSRFLSLEELARLRTGLNTAEPKIALFVRWVLATGCRRSEARSAKWSDLDLTRQRWTKPQTKSGRWHIVPIPDQLAAELRRFPKVGPWVFMGPHGQPWSFAGIEKAWGRVRRACGLTDVRLHDLRRTAASHMAIAGENLTTIQKMLDHSSLQATAIYARLDLETLSRAMQRNADRMFAPE